MVSKPVVNGSAGTWGTIVNQALDDLQAGVDASVKSALVTTKGDLLAATGNAALTRVPTGSTGQVLTADSTQAGGTKFADTALPQYLSTARPAIVAGQISMDSDTGMLWFGATYSGTAYRLPFPGTVVTKLRQTANAQSFTSGTAAALQWTAADYDRLSGYSASFTTRWTASVPGRYEFAGAVSFAANSTGYRLVRWALNGAAYNASSTVVPAAAVQPTVVPARTAVIAMVPGDYVELIGQQNSGGALATDLTLENQPLMSVKFVGAY